MRKEYSYDAYGNVLTMIEKPEDGEDLYLKVSYLNTPDTRSRYQVSLPSELWVCEGDSLDSSKLLRHRKGEYDNKGHMTAFIIYDGASAMGIEAPLAGIITASSPASPIRLEASKAIVTMMVLLST